MMAWDGMQAPCAHLTVSMFRRPHADAEYYAEFVVSLEWSSPIAGHSRKNTDFWRMLMLSMYDPAFVVSLEWASIVVTGPSHDKPTLKGMLILNMMRIRGFSWGTSIVITGPSRNKPILFGGLLMLTTVWCWPRGLSWVSQHRNYGPFS